MVNRYAVYSSQRDTLYSTQFNNFMQDRMDEKLKKKLFGIGVGPAFLGGAGFGYGAGLLTYSIYHRYNYIRNMMFHKGYLTTDQWDQSYYNNFYKRC